MNIDRVNVVLGKAINHFQATEMEEMQETIDELVGDAQGSDVLDEYVSNTIVSGLGKVEASNDDIIDAMFEVAEAAADSGKLPPVPDMDEATEDDWTEWVEAATEAGLHEATLSLIQKRAAAA